MGLTQISKREREKLLIMPSNKEFTQELSSDKKYKLNKDGTLTLKNKLVMREGTHNDVIYTWEQLKEKYMTGEGAGLFYDHEDSVQNYAGLVKNLRLDEKEKAIYGDVYVTNKQSALDISLGAKWGISPTIDAEKLLKDGKKYAHDPNFLSYSLVLKPAVRETMLNSENNNSDLERGKNKLENERKMFELAQEAKLKDTKIQELENAVTKLGKDAEESKKKIDDAESKEVAREAEELCNLECSIGFTTDAEKNTRLEELKNLSAESRSSLKTAHEKYAKILKLGEEEDETDEKGTENKEGEDSKKKEGLKETNASTNPQERMKAELAEQANSRDKVNSDILAYMREQERK